MSGLAVLLGLPYLGGALPDSLSDLPLAAQVARPAQAELFGAP